MQCHTSDLLRLDTDLTANPLILAPFGKTKIYCNRFAIPHRTDMLTILLFCAIIRLKNVCQLPQRAENDD